MIRITILQALVEQSTVGIGSGRGRAEDRESAQRRGNFATAAIVKWALGEAGQCLNQVGQGQYQVSNAPTFFTFCRERFSAPSRLSPCFYFAW